MGAWENKCQISQELWKNKQVKLLTFHVRDVILTFIIPVFIFRCSVAFTQWIKMRTSTSTSYWVTNPNENLFTVCGTWIIIKWLWQHALTIKIWHCNKFGSAKSHLSVSDYERFIQLLHSKIRTVAVNRSNVKCRLWTIVFMQGWKTTRL